MANTPANPPENLDPALSPAERHARDAVRRAHPLVSEFQALYGFAFDDYQLEACRIIEDGSGVLVAAPTGAGKTIAGEFGVFLAIAEGRKCFYTTPIKALSNQKFADLVARHGAEKVGLLTGDSSINSEAPVVVMTTEVLRNMIYANSPTLKGLGYVVMDEVHYLGDRFRGAVWEEVIIGLADTVQVIALSATVSNTEEFGEWLDEVRGDVRLVVSERRPTPLYQHVLVGRKLHDLFADVAPTAVLDPAQAAKAEVNPELVTFAKQESRIVRDDSRHPRGRSGRGKRPGGRGGRPSAFGGGAAANQRAKVPKRFQTPRRSDVVAALERHELLPAIVFVFSRTGCDAAVKQLLGDGICLTTAQERRELVAIADRHVAGLSEKDRSALGYDVFVEAMINGIACHHAGLLPALKEAVEEAFVRGLVKVVFATETLALGINMPARSVVLEKLVKFNGETHADITPGEYTQLTGRAGRRGIDVEGHAIVLWQPGFDPRSVAGLASRRTYPLRSSFAPTYNMAVNMVARVGRERARTLLEQSFAQFQTDRSVVGIARTVAKNKDAARALWRSIEVTDEHGAPVDVEGWARLREEKRALEAEVARSRKVDKRAESLQALLSLRPGDIIAVPAGRSAGWAAVIEPSTQTDGDGPRPLVMTADKQIRRLGLVDFPTPTEVYGRIRIPKRFNAKEPSSRRNLHAALRQRLDEIGPKPPRWRSGEVDPEVAEALDALREQIRRHPAQGLVDREHWARIAERALRLERENATLEQRMSSRTNTIALHFDKICTVLESLGYLGEGGATVTESGRTLARIYNELDLVAAECLREGVFDDLDAPRLAAVLSTLVYEARRSDDRRQPRMPDSVTAERFQRLRRVHREVGLAERDVRLQRGPDPDVGFAEPAHSWCSGAGLAEVVRESGLPAGDFVRWVRQVIDFAEQIANAAGPGAVQTTCRQLVGAMRRGVVDFTPEEDDAVIDALEEQFAGVEDGGVEDGGVEGGGVEGGDA